MQKNLSTRIHLSGVILVTCLTLQAVHDIYIPIRELFKYKKEANLASFFALSYFLIIITYYLIIANIVYAI